MVGHGLPRSKEDKEKTISAGERETRINPHAVPTDLCNVFFLSMDSHRIDECQRRKTLWPLNFNSFVVFARRIFRFILWPLRRRICAMLNIYGQTDEYWGTGTRLEWYPIYRDYESTTAHWHIPNLHKNVKSNVWRARNGKDYILLTWCSLSFIHNLPLTSWKK